MCTIKIPTEIIELETIKEYDEEIIKLSSEIIDMAIKIIPFGEVSARNIIDNETRQRYLGINRAILLTLKDCDIDNIRISDLNEYEIEKLMLSWITLGSAIESSMQIFPSIFKHNYDDNSANK